MQNHDDFEVLESKTVYNGSIFDVNQLIVRLPNGREARRDIVKHNGASSVIAFVENGDMLMVRQYREGTKSTMLEFPAGKLDPGESPEVCALRELEEETGYKAESLKFLLSIHVAAAYNTEQIFLYLAEGLVPGKPCPDTDEFVTVETHPLSAVLEMIKNGEITDSKTVAGALYCAHIGIGS